MLNSYYNYGKHENSYRLELRYLYNTAYSFLVLIPILISMQLNNTLFGNNSIGRSYM